MNEATKTLLMNTVKEWGKYVSEREKITMIAYDVAQLSRRVIQECLAFMKAQRVEVECDTLENLKVLGVPIQVNPTIEAAFPAVKATVVLKCGGATRAIVVNPNYTISAGGTPIAYEQLKKGIPDLFAANAAEFVRDAFLNVARTGGKEEKPIAN